MIARVVPRRHRRPLNEPRMVQCTYQEIEVGTSWLLEDERDPIFAADTCADSRQLSCAFASEVTKPPRLHRARERAA